MAEENNNNNQESNESQNNQQVNQQNIQMTQEQLQDIIKAATQGASQNASRDDTRENKEGFIKKSFDKTKNTLDTNTRGMDGSVFSIFRWFFALVRDMVEGLREYISMQQAKRKIDKDERDDS